MSSYRYISNLTTISKVIERLVLDRLRPHLLSSPNFSRLQSAYRRGHSTETALLHVVNTVYTTADAKKITALVGLVISAAFDTIDHESQFCRRCLQLATVLSPRRPVSSSCDLADTRLLWPSETMAVIQP